jgi:hypothetical protein
MSGLPDEAVDAMARALAPFNQVGVSLAGRSAYAHEMAKAALAALPAGLWYSDGQGTVKRMSRVLAAPDPGRQDA